MVIQHSSYVSGVPEARPPAPARQLLPGTHLRTARRGYAHHGIYVGAGQVIHYAGLHRGWRAGPVEQLSLEDFAQGHPVEIVAHRDVRFRADEAVRRARSRLGEHCYRLLTNNCEHFCNWCLNGEPRSEQVEQAFAALSRLIAAAPGAGRFAGVAVEPSD